MCSKKTLFVRFCLLTLANFIAPDAFAATDFPTKTIKIVVPLAAGGGGDIIARLLANKMQAELGQSVVVENRPGGGSVIGTEAVARAAPDGYTLLMATSSHVINGSVMKLPYDSVKDFEGVSLVATSPLILSVSGKFPAKTLPELIELARSRPEGLTYASSGLGGLPHLSGELLARMAGVKLTHIPYKGSGPAEAALLGGQIDMFFASPTSAAAQFSSGTMRPLATTTATRSASLPNVPAVAEFYPGFNAATLYAILAPVGTPPDVINKLNAALRRAAEAPDVKTRLIAQGAELVESTPAETMPFIESQVRQWNAIVKDANIKIE